jgi:sec-independent protein translocase protein TatA
MPGDANWHGAGWKATDERFVSTRTDDKEMQMLAEIFGVDGVIVLIVVVVLLFGGAAIPKLARNLGSAKNEFEKGLDEGKKASNLTTHTASSDNPPTTASPAPTATPAAHVNPGA